MILILRAVMRRREFISLLGGVATAWPLMARGQQPAQMRRIGVLMNRTPDDQRGQAGVAAFKQDKLITSALAVVAKDPTFCE